MLVERVARERSGGSEGRCEIHFQRVISNKLHVEAGRAGAFMIRSVGVIVVEVQVRADVAGSLDSEAKEW